MGVAALLLGEDEASRSMSETGGRALAAASESILPSTPLHSLDASIGVHDAFEVEPREINLGTPESLEAADPLKVSRFMVSLSERGRVAAGVALNGVVATGTKAAAVLLTTGSNRGAIPAHHSSPKDCNCKSGRMDLKHVPSRPLCSSACTSPTAVASKGGSLCTGVAATAGQRIPGVPSTKMHG